VRLNVLEFLNMCLRVKLNGSDLVSLMLEKRHKVMFKWKHVALC